MKIDNLDAMDSDELYEATMAFYKLAMYCTEKRAALLYGKEGRIKDALRHEKSAKGIYKQLPEEYRW